MRLSSVEVRFSVSERRPKETPPPQKLSEGTPLGLIRDTKAHSGASGIWCFHGWRRNSVDVFTVSIN